MTTTAYSMDDLLNEAPFVQALARALAGEDADDVVQGTWLRAVQGNAHAVRDPRSWLLCIVRGVAHNLRRSHSRRGTREQATGRSGFAPSAAELIERQELRRELHDAVEALPPAQRTVILLRHFENLPPRRIAAHLNIPVNTVESRLRTALETLRRRLDQRRGDRRAWIATLLPGHAEPEAIGIGLLAMTIKGKIVTAAGAVLVAALALWALNSPPPPPSPGSGTGISPPPIAAGDIADSSTDGPNSPDRTAVRSDDPRSIPLTGFLTVSAIHADDRSPVPNLLVRIGRAGADHRFGFQRARTDAQGVARFELHPGKVFVTNTRNPRGYVRPEVIAGEEVEVDLVLPTGATVTGIVTDHTGTPIAGAEVCIAGGGALQDAEVEAISDAAGRFVVRSCESPCSIAARAAGYHSSRVELIHLPEGGSRELELVLAEPGGMVAGTVFGPDHEPVPGALVAIGGRHSRRLDTAADGSLRAVLRTAADGSFRAIGLPPGTNEIHVRSTGLAPFAGTCQVDRGLTTTTNVTLEKGVACSGVVVDSAGTPVARATVEVGNVFELEYWKALSAADGTFRLEGLHSGSIELSARHQEMGTAKMELHGSPGEEKSCELRLSQGAVLRGRVLAADGEPIAAASIDVRSPATRTTEFWGRWITADHEGQFVLAQCPENRPLFVTASAYGFETSRIDDIDPASGPLLIHLVPAPERHAHIVGRVLLPDGNPVQQAVVYADQLDGDGEGQTPADDSGAFDIGPVEAGSWQLVVQTPGQAKVWSGPHRLATNSRLDLGTIRLPVAGTILVRLRGTTDGRVSVVIADHSFTRWTGFRGPGLERQSSPIAPGKYYVSVSGDGVAARLIPVAVHAGEQYELDVEVRPGHRQQFEMVAPQKLTERHFRITQNGVLVRGSSRRGFQPGQDPQAFEEWLAPGDYEIEANAAGLTGRARFAVVAGSNPKVRVALQ